MPWKECNPMDERLRFIARRLEGEKMAPLCREFGPLVGRSENHICINSEFGVTLVFAGLETRLRRRISSFIHGVGDDARDPKDQLLNYLDKMSAT